MYFDYKLIEDNAGHCYLFVRDFGGPQVHGIEPTLYCFSHGLRSELVRALAEIMESPKQIDLDEWSGWGDHDDPETLLAELQKLIDEGKNRANVVMDGNIYA